MNPTRLTSLYAWMRAVQIELELLTHRSCGREMTLFESFLTELWFRGDIGSREAARKVMDKVRP